MIALASLLLAAAQIPFACPPDIAPQVAPIDTEYRGRPREASGDGLWIGGIAFGARDIATVSTRFDDRGGAWAVALTLSPEGMTSFAQAQHCRVGKAMEISVDGRVISNPILNEPIAGSELEINGNFSAEEAQDMARQILGPDDSAGAY